MCRHAAKINHLFATLTPALLLALKAARTALLVSAFSCHTPCAAAPQQLKKKHLGSNRTMR